MNPESSHIKHIKAVKKRHNQVELNHELLKQVEIEDPEGVLNLIDEGANLHLLEGVHIHAYNGEQNTLLHTASSLGNTEIMQILIEHGANIHSRNRRLFSCLHMATMVKGSIEPIKLLVDRGADVESEDDDHATPFIWSAYLNNLKAMNFFLDKNCITNKKDRFNYNAFHWACFQGNLPIVKELYKKRDLLDKLSINLDEGMDNAIENGHVDVVEYLESLHQK